MKKITRILAMVTIVLLCSLTKSKAQAEIGVRVRLNRPAQYERNERERPGRPSARHIWIAEEWVPQGGTYVYRAGYWALPPREHAYWISGHWAKRIHYPGYVWVPGRYGYTR